jgi:hypothetical protein
MGLKQIPGARIDGLAPERKSISFIVLTWVAFAAWQVKNERFTIARTATDGFCAVKATMSSFFTVPTSRPAVNSRQLSSELSPKGQRWTGASGTSPNDRQPDRQAVNRSARSNRLPAVLLDYVAFLFGLGSGRRVGFTVTAVNAHELKHAPSTK